MNNCPSVITCYEACMHDNNQCRQSMKNNSVDSGYTAGWIVFKPTTTEDFQNCQSYANDAVVDSVESIDASVCVPYCRSSVTGVSTDNRPLCSSLSSNDPMKQAIECQSAMPCYEGDWKHTIPYSMTSGIASYVLFLVLLLNDE